MGEGVKRGKEEEEEVVMLMEDPAAAAEEEDVEVVEEGDGVMRLERFLLKMPVRVLLVEGDDSTRQIIAALLRKCSYRGLFLPPLCFLVLICHEFGVDACFLH